MARPLARELITPGLHVDRAGFYAGTAALNTVPLIGALTWGLLAGELDTGVLVAGGALFTGIPGLGDPPRRRMTAMMITGVLATISTFFGIWTGGTDVVAMALMAIWAFAGAMLGSLGRTEGLIGATSVLSLLLVAQYPADAAHAALHSLSVLAGSALQVAVTMLVWRIVRDRPQRTALAAAYGHLAELARAPRREGELNRLFAALRAAAKTIHDAEGGPAPRSERGTARRRLLREAEAIALEIGALRSLGDQGVAVAGPLEAEAEGLEALAEGLRARHDPVGFDAIKAKADEAQAAMAASGEGDPALRAEALERLRHLRTRLHAAWAAGGVATGPHVRGRMVDLDGLRDRRREARATLRANLTLQSAIFRHAIRLAAATTVGVAVYRIFDIPHGYWIPLTVLFVLRPDFGTTFSRGALRAAGTIAGILLAAGIMQVIGTSDWLTLIPIAIFTWGTLAFLFANYAAFTASITVVVVLLLDLAGEPAVATMDDRLVASAIGIVIALLAFLVWPTWTAERMAAAVGTYVVALRAYVLAVLGGCVDPAGWEAGDLEPLRTRHRLARANADDALAATLHEPEGRRERTDAAGALLGAGYRVHEAAIVLDVHLRDGDLHGPLPGLAWVAEDVGRELDLVERWWTGDGDEPDPPRSTPPLPAAEPAVAHEAHALVDAAHAMACAAR